jgi:hypothetical protein
MTINKTNSKHPVLCQTAQTLLFSIFGALILLVLPLAVAYLFKK